MKVISVENDVVPSKYTSPKWSEAKNFNGIHSIVKIGSDKCRLFAKKEHIFTHRAARIALGIIASFLSGGLLLLCSGVQNLFKRKIAVYFGTPLNNEINSIVPFKSKNVDSSSSFDLVNSKLSSNKLTKRTATSSKPTKRTTNKSAVVDSPRPLRKDGMATSKTNVGLTRAVANNRFEILNGPEKKVDSNNNNVLRLTNGEEIRAHSHKKKLLTLPSNQERLALPSKQERLALLSNQERLALPSNQEPEQEDNPFIEMDVDALFEISEKMLILPKKDIPKLIDLCEKEIEVVPEAKEALSYCISEARTNSLKERVFIDLFKSDLEGAIELLYTFEKHGFSDVGLSIFIRLFKQAQTEYSKEKSVDLLGSLSSSLSDPNDVNWLANL